MKIVDIVLKAVFTLILAMPVLGLFGVLGEATRDLYNTDAAFAFIQMLMDARYINVMMAVAHVIAVIALWTRREGLAALIVLPITLNVVGFHLVLDGGLFTGGAVLADIMLLINLYLIWRYRDTYRGLLAARA
ncbi:MAG TPA: hypothetical protein VHO23_01600 [Candidatus Paceibacterota bacterium]|nr:hypothetical protein [Candidatus Paceibacterota bacterium]